MSQERVNHPIHYNWVPGDIEALSVVKHFNFCLGNAMKYIWRAPVKSDREMLVDLRKALFYIKEEIRMVEERIDTAESMRTLTNL
jgi:hypothetical protein